MLRIPPCALSSLIHHPFITPTPALTEGSNSRFSTCSQKLILHEALCQFWPAPRIRGAVKVNLRSEDRLFGLSVRVGGHEVPITSAVHSSTTSRPHRMTKSPCPAPQLCTRLSRIPTPSNTNQGTRKRRFGRHLSVGGIESPPCDC